jgi:hypothetical protein
VGKPNPPASWVGLNPRGSSIGASGFPQRLGDDPLEDSFIEPRGQDRFQQRARVPAFQGRDAQLGQTRDGLVELASGKEERDLFRHRSAGDEGQGPGGRAVEPLRVINGTRERLILGGLGEQAEDGQPDQEPLRRVPS